MAKARMKDDWRDPFLRHKYDFESFNGALESSNTRGLLGLVYKYSFLINFSPVYCSFYTQ